jgi:hypothetical protein
MSTLTIDAPAVRPDFTATNETQPDPTLPDPVRFAADLDAAMRDVLAGVEASEPWLAVSSSDADPPLVRAVVKHILLEVFSYGPHVTEATFTAIGRLPKTRGDLMQVMINHDLDEVDHGEMALKDFVKLGGDEAFARGRRITPASFAMAATVRMLGEREDPFAYLGYMYLFEALTPILTEKARHFLAAKAFPKDAQHFVDFHATEDIAHAKVLRTLIERVVKDYPSAAASIRSGFDCFAAVYPLPVWAAALERARAEVV